ncbi:hypothetical protein GQ44DRAFT_730700 [Phaeosphaeriaceae sp. PMI808]|nr:hypothetical protein GQ44DRAFT_730700 [Phaeosphaeriaceae sp. PMI808]
MSPSQLGILANLALAATAVLIPSTMTPDDTGYDHHTIQGLAMNPFQRSVALECPNCPIASPGENPVFVHVGIGNAFLLEFAIGSHGDTLEIDKGYQLYPPAVNEALAPFHVTQIDPHAETPLRLRVTAYTLSYNSAVTISEQGTELFPMTLQIAALEGTAIKPPALTINVLKDASGRLMMASIKLTPVSEPKSTKAEKKCSEWPLFCKWKSIVANRVEKMKGKGCSKRPHGLHNPMEEDTMEGKPPHRFHPDRLHGRPHHRPHHKGHKHHGNRHGHHSQHRLRMFASRALFTVLIPIAIGILAGAVTYFIGMALGTFIAILIVKVRGQEYQRIMLDEEVEEHKVGGQSDTAEYAELPAYDEPPVYEEGCDGKVADSK